MLTAKVTSKGQITIPKEVRDKLWGSARRRHWF
ncbi:MAG: AbrB/MazE/SpoVT family DNA-binding domain-containing protein [Nitrospirae bacterium]|nr:AbrB/MazE/SpoVT family DNA-binding domain-containing protein [Nitrospirota bacterium]